MAAGNEDEDTVQQISSTCAAAKQTLEAIGNLQSNDIQYVAALAATKKCSKSVSTVLLYQQCA